MLHTLYGGYLLIDVSCCDLCQLLSEKGISLPEVGLEILVLIIFVCDLCQCVSKKDYY